MTRLRKLVLDPFERRPPQKVFNALISFSSAGNFDQTAPRFSKSEKKTPKYHNTSASELISLTQLSGIKMGMSSTGLGPILFAESSNQVVLPWKYPYRTFRIFAASGQTGLTADLRCAAGASA